jgi:Tol biopolymer transport system component
MPGYGYRYEDEGYLNENAPRNSGLFLINLKENSRSLILSLNELIADIIDIPGVLESQHYVTHSEFSYDGKYISFLHRWTTKDIRVRQTRLVIYDLNNKTHIALPTEGMVSHYVWNQDNQIIAYCNVQQEDCHVLFNVPNVSDFKKIVPEKLNSDGHQSFITNTEFVTDTYPDKYRMAKLYKVQIENDEVQLLASLHSPKKFQTRDFQKHISCDLHPRVSPGGKYVSFDSIRYNYRSLCVMKLPN